MRVFQEKARMPKTRTAAAPAPHSWDLEHWPSNVYPHSESRARWLLRAHRDELLAAGALTRIGREIVVLGARYSRWLESKSHDVPGFVAIPRARAMQ
jgi:hypothetical protein